MSATRLLARFRRGIGPAEHFRRGRAERRRIQIDTGNPHHLRLEPNVKLGNCFGKTRRRFSGIVQFGYRDHPGATRRLLKMPRLRPDAIVSEKPGSIGRALRLHLCGKGLELRARGTERKRANDSWHGDLPHDGHSLMAAVTMCNGLKRQDCRRVRFTASSGAWWRAWVSNESFGRARVEAAAISICL